jgi:hypothetical protein
MDTVFVSSALLRCEVWHVSDFAGKTSSLAISASAFDRIKLSQIEVTLADQVTISNATEQLRTSSRVVVIEDFISRRWTCHLSSKSMVQIRKYSFSWADSLLNQMSLHPSTRPAWFAVVASFDESG